MAKRKIYMTAQDMDRIDLLLISVAGSEIDAHRLESLEKELDKAERVPSDKVPPDVVTMNSKVRVLNLDTREETVFTLVFPEHENREEGKLSLLEPIGMAVLGYKAGDRIEWKTPEGDLTLRIEEVLYQPEAAGHHP